MKVRVEYTSNTFLPEEIAQQFEVMKKKIHEVPGEPDKIELIVEQMRGHLIRWIVNNQVR